MTFLYEALDKIAKRSGFPRLMAILTLLVALALPLTGLYFLFRTYNEVGLSALVIIYFVLMPRDSYLERKEMQKSEKQLKTVQANN